ncbi:hypothetical protein BQ8794_170016 [Mesorhizobium prunaredense]|uniref:Uncharacterized protein n=1 Tax=Mesorhizobium prunaredense TaxID=1631249 RepID=A0A1R3V3N6_9HYPH|nr:hypothetical protein BQ8794_170016 [Mesorhizobium prunaredense]
MVLQTNHTTRTTQANWVTTSYEGDFHRDTTSSTKANTPTTSTTKRSSPKPTRAKTFLDQQSCDRGSPGSPLHCDCLLPCFAPFRGDGTWRLAGRLW